MAEWRVVSLRRDKVWDDQREVWSWEAGARVQADHQVNESLLEKALRWAFYMVNATDGPAWVTTEKVE